MSIRVALLLALAGGAHGWRSGAVGGNIIIKHQHHHARSSRRTTSQAPLMMAGASSSLPEDVKSTVSSLRGSLQAALRERLSRVEVDLPSDARLGVEGGNPAPGKTDRELSRLIWEMFEGTPVSDNVLIAFDGAQQAEAARRQWRGSKIADRVVSLDGKGPASAGGQLKKKGRRGGKRSQGFAALMEEGEGGDDDEPASAAGGAGGIVPRTTEVLVVAGPTEKSMRFISERVSPVVKDACLVVLLNAKLDTVSYADASLQETLRAEYKPIFFLRGLPPAPGSAPGGGGGGVGEVDTFLYRQFPNDFTFLRKRKVGPPKVLEKQSSRLSKKEFESACERLSAERAKAPGGIFGDIF